LQGCAYSYAGRGSPRGLCPAGACLREPWMGRAPLAGLPLSPLRAPTGAAGSVLAVASGRVPPRERPGPRLRRLPGGGVSCFWTSPSTMSPTLRRPSSRRTSTTSACPSRPRHSATARAHGELLDCLRGALHSGRVVYLQLPRRDRPHRHGDRLPAGRERALGEAALQELNRLWQQSERAALWPHVRRPRADRVRARWVRPDAARADPLFEPPYFQRRAACGSAFTARSSGWRGGCVAAATQYRRPGKFTPVGDMLGGGPF